MRNLSYSRNIEKKRFDKMTDYLFRGPWHHVLLRRRDGKPLDVNQDGEIVRNVVEWELELVQKGLHLVVPKGVTL